MVEDKKKSNNNGKGLAIGAVGAVAGAALGVAAAVVMSDKKTREKVMDTVNAIKDQAVDTVSRMQKHAEPLTQDAEEKLKEGKEKVQKKLSGTAKK